jgi:hypothetical protein
MHTANHHKTSQHRTEANQKSDPGFPSFRRVNNHERAESLAYDFQTRLLFSQIQADLSYSLCLRVSDDPNAYLHPIEYQGSTDSKEQKVQRNANISERSETDQLEGTWGDGRSRITSRMSDEVKSQSAQRDESIVISWIERL